MPKRKPKGKTASWEPKIDSLRRAANRTGVPMFLPTEERADVGDLQVEQIRAPAFESERPGRKAPRMVLVGYALRDRSVDVMARLRRYSRLTDEQIVAGAKLAADIELSGLEPRMVANLSGAAGGGDGPQNLRIDARTRVHYAVRMLDLCGAETTRVVLGVIAGNTSAKTSAPIYADAEKGRAHVAAHLSVGLNVLVNHYRLEAQHGPEAAAKARIRARRAKSAPGAP